MRWYIRVLISDTSPIKRLCERLPCWSVCSGTYAVVGQLLRSKNRTRRFKPVGHGSKRQALKVFTLQSPQFLTRCHHRLVGRTQCRPERGQAIMKKRISRSIICCHSSGGGTHWLESYTGPSEVISSTSAPRSSMLVCTELRWLDMSFHSGMVSFPALYPVSLE